MTNAQLLQYHHQITTWTKRGMIEAYFHSGKINEFYKQFSIRIETLNLELEKMNDKYFIKDEQGIIKTEGEKGKEKPVYKDGFTMEMFNKEYIDFMSAEIGTLKVVSNLNGHG